VGEVPPDKAKEGVPPKVLSCRGAQLKRRTCLPGNNSMHGSGDVEGGKPALVSGIQGGKTVIFRTMIYDSPFWQEKERAASRCVVKGEKRCGKLLWVHRVRREKEGTRRGAINKIP